MSEKQKPDQQFPLRFPFAQRKCIAEIFSEFSERLKLDEPNERLVSFSLDELRAIHQNARLGISQAGSGMKQNSLRRIVYLTEEAIERFQGIGAIPSKERIYQLKITLKDLKPVIWRRIQVRDCTLDKLHDHIQTAMGWTNSHLHHFRINDKFYGDPWLMEEDFGDQSYANTRITRLNAIIPKSGRRFSFAHVGAPLP